MGVSQLARANLSRMASYAPGDPGLDRNIVIDGHVFSLLPSSLSSTPEPIEDAVDLMDAGSKVFTLRPHFDGVANVHSRYSFSVPYARLQGDDLVAMDEIEATGGVHLLALWKLRTAIFTASGQTSIFYFPRYRRNAAQVYAGLTLPQGGVPVSTANFPTFVSVDGVVQNVGYANGPANTLAAPAAGSVTIAKNPNTTGTALGYTGMRFGAVPAKGARIKVQWPPAFEVLWREPQERYSGMVESRQVTLVER